VKSYDVRVVNNSPVNINTTELVNKVRIDGFKFDRDHPDVVLLISIDKITASKKVISETPPKDAKNPNPETSWYYVADLGLETSMRIVTPDMHYESYVRKLAPLASSIRSISAYPTEANANKAAGTYSPDPATLTNLVIQNVYLFQGYANESFGYSKMTENVAVVTIKSKDFDYADMDQALAKYKSAVEIFSANGQTDEARKLFSEAAAIWDKNAGEFKADDKKAKINSKNITEIYLNLVIANICLDNYAEAQKYLDLSANEKGNNSEKLQLDDLIKTRKPAYEANVLREQNKLVIDKKFCSFYIAPDFQVNVHPYRIKYDMNVSSSNGWRRVYDYDKNGLLTRTYIQRPAFGNTYQGMEKVEQMDSVKYDHENLTMSFYNVKEKKIMGMQIVKAGRIISTQGDIGEYMMTYDKGGKLLKYVKKSPYGNGKEVTNHKYENGQLKSITQKNIAAGDSIVNYSINLTWSGDKLASTTGSDPGFNKTFKYDANGLLLGNAPFTFRYDAFGNIVEITTPNDGGGASKQVLEWEKGSGNVVLFKSAYPVGGPRSNPLLALYQVY
jgi:tetratricopeptide (TPR) repeat protein